MFGRENVKSLEDKVAETIERMDHLVALVPMDHLTWRPALPHQHTAAIDLGHLLGHLLDCLAGFCAALYAAYPTELADFTSLRSLQVNHFCLPEDARRQINIFAAHIHRGFGQITDSDLARKIPTVFVPEGETLLSLLLGNLEHLINHKYQLFFYLKLAGLAVNTQDLYAWRGARQE